jgi:hypothetical protein
LINDTEFLNQDLTDEFPLMQIDATIPHHPSTPPSTNKDNKQMSFISILKTLGGTQQKPTIQKTPSTPTTTQPQQHQQHQNEIKEFPTTSPLESLIKSIKTNNNKIEIPPQVDVEIDNSQMKKTELSSKPYTILSEEDYMEHKDSVIHLKHSPDGRNIASIDSKGTIKSNKI